MNPIEILGIIPARAGSKGLIGKNIRCLGGEPLISFTAKAATSSELLSKVILSTENSEIADIGLRYGLEVPFMRPDYLATDISPSLPVFQYTVSKLEDIYKCKPKVIVILQPTSPFRNKAHIDEAIRIFLETNADSLVSVIEVPHNMIPESIMELTDNKELKPFTHSYNENYNLRQLKPKYYARNGAAIYIVSYDCLMNKNSLFGKKIIPFFMDKISSVDIDDISDFIIAEALLKSGKVSL